MPSTSLASRARRPAAAALVALALTAGAMAGCGGDEKSEQDVEALLDRAFRQSVDSADVSVDAQLEVDGLQGLERPVRLEASGPYIDTEGTLPKLDIDVKVGAQEAGQTVQAGFLSTGDRAFLKFGGEFYEQPREDVEQANRQLAPAGGQNPDSLGDLGLEPRKWVVDAKAEGTDEVAGVATEHVSGKLDTRAVLEDLNGLVDRSTGLPGAPQPLGAAELQKLADVVRDPSFDVYVGKDDDRIRRLSGSLEIVVPEEDRARFGGMEGGSIQFSLELADVNGDQRVATPTGARPISDLATQLGGLGALGGAAGGGGGGGATGGSGSEQPEPDALRRYSECLDRARPDDTDALSRCAELLR